MATKDWPAAVERVTAYLREAGAEVRVEEFAEATPTAKEAARVIGCELAQIAKSLVFDCDGRRVVVLVPGDRRADAGKIARAAGAQSARIASSEEVRDATGFEPGAVAPFPLPRVETVLLERTLLSQPVLWIGAGSERHMAALSPTELMRLSRGRPMDAVDEDT